MVRQHCTPVLLPVGGGMPTSLRLVGQYGGANSVSEAEIQALVHAHPELLPIAEIDPIFLGAVPICRELVTAAGQIDNLFVTPSGLPVIVECKLWRNPEGRREVVGQILDYAKELSRWSSSDLQREVKRRLGGDGNPLLELVRLSNPQVDETEFNDALTFNLRRGRFLLLIVGDGIREGVEAIAEYLQAHAGLHFSLGLIELPIFMLPDGSRIVLPRVLTRTTLITRHVVAHPDGHKVQELTSESLGDEPDPERTLLQDAQQRFWAEFLPHVRLDDPEQVIPKPSRMGYLSFMLPAPSGSSWLTVYRDSRRNEVGIFLSSSRNSAGEYATNVIVDDWNVVDEQLGGSARVEQKDGRPRVIDSLSAGPLDQLEARKEAFGWLAERLNTFVNVLRPRVRSAVADYRADNG